YLESDREYFIRFGVVMLLDYYVDGEYLEKLYAVFDSIHHEGYYVKMAVAWALSVCYVKFPKETRRYLENNKALDDFTYNKAIQKTCESYRVEPEEKERLKTMKRKSVG
ncbi:MAG: DNA alkylation repair protein, partial [Acetivibrio ethanolgignens]